MTAAVEKTRFSSTTSAAEERGVLNDGDGGGGNEAKVGRWGNALALKKCINNNKQQ